MLPVLAASHGMQLLGTLMSPAQQRHAWYSLPQARQQEANKSSSMRRYPCSSSSSIGSSSSQETAGLLMLSQAASATNISSSSGSSSKQACPTSSSVCLSRGTTSLCSNQRTPMESTHTQVQVFPPQQLHS
jgi:hypothetical protein